MKKCAFAVLELLCTLIVFVVSIGAAFQIWNFKMAGKRRFTSKRRARRNFSRRRATFSLKSFKKVKRMVKAVRPPLQYSDALKVGVFGTWDTSVQERREDEIIGHESGQQPWAVYSLNPISPGTGNQDSTAGFNVFKQSVKLKMIRLRIKAFAGSAIGTLTTAPSNVAKQFRVIVAICQDYTPIFQTVSPSFTEIIEGATSSTDDSAMTSPVSAQGRQRWGILHDRVYSLDSTKGFTKEIKIIKKLRQNVYYPNSNVNPAGAANIAPGHGGLFCWVIYGMDSTVYTPAAGTNYITYDIANRSWVTLY